MNTDPKNTPEYNGYNTKMCQDLGYTVRFATTLSFRPLINLPPDDYDTLLTTMCEAQYQIQSLGQEWTIFTADQQLYRKIVDIIIVYPDFFQSSFHV